jgi:hypothetical protein
MINTNKLSFGQGNSKLSPAISTFSLPAGFSCPFAKDCLSKANRLTGKIIDGKHCQFRCFAASQECAYPSVRKSRWANFERLKNEDTIKGKAKLIQDSLPLRLGYIRVHVSGDFFNEKYFVAWLNVALNNPLVIFYGYTKATPFLVEYKKHLPSNFRFTASKGGTHDDLIARHRLKFAQVVYSVKEAADLGLEIDHDDTLAIAGQKSLGLLVHGTQPAGSAANTAWRALIADGTGGYGKGNRNKVNLVRDIPIQVQLSNSGKIYVPVQGFKTLPKYDGWRTLAQSVFSIS